MIPAGPSLDNWTDAQYTVMQPWESEFGWVNRPNINRLKRELYMLRSWRQDSDKECLTWAQQRRMIDRMIRGKLGGDRFGLSML